MMILKLMKFKNVF